MVVGLTIIAAVTLGIFFLAPVYPAPTQCIPAGANTCIGATTLIKSLSCVSVGIGAVYMGSNFEYEGSPPQYHLGCFK